MKAGGRLSEMSAEEDTVGAEGEEAGGWGLAGLGGVWTPGSGEGATGGG